jgi:tetratricopeptide (TPR) repeat protein
VADFSASWRNRRQILSALTAIVIGLLSWRAWVQTSYWKNDKTVWTRTLAVTSNNAVAHLSLGHISLENGQTDDAISHFQESLKISSQSRVYGVSTALANNGLGDALLARGLVSEAIAHYRKALQIKPDYAAAENNLALALFRNGSIDEAIVHWQKALSLDPNLPNAYAGLGDAMLQQHLTGEAIALYEKSLQLAPVAPSLNGLAWVLATSSDAKFRNGPRAIQLAQQAIQLTRGKNPRFIRTLAAAHAQAGEFDEAIRISEEALKLAATNDPALATQLQMDIDLYRMNFTLH